MLKYEYGRTRHSIADNSPSSVTFLMLPTHEWLAR